MARKTYASLAAIFLLTAVLTPIIPRKAAGSEESSPFHRLYPIVPLAASSLYLAQGKSKAGQDFARIIAMASSFSFAYEMSEAVKATGLVVKSAAADAAAGMMLFVPAALLEQYAKSDSLSTLGKMTSAASVSLLLRAGTTLYNQYQNQLATQTAVGASALLALPPLATLKSSSGKDLQISCGVGVVYFFRGFVLSRLEWLGVLSPEGIASCLLAFTGVAATSLVSPESLSGVIAQTLIEAGAYTGIAPLARSAENVVRAYVPEIKIHDAAKTATLLGLGFAFSNLAAPPGQKKPIHQLWAGASTALYMEAGFGMLGLAKSYASTLFLSSQSGEQKAEL